jgi:hypothetical protein
MRHAGIKTTTDYHANVDDAALEAVLGAGRNTSRHKNREKPVDDRARRHKVRHPKRFRLNRRRHLLGYGFCQKPPWPLRDGFASTRLGSACFQGFRGVRFPGK